MPKSVLGPPLPPQPPDPPTPTLALPRTLPDRPPEDVRRAVHEERIKASTIIFSDTMREYIDDVFNSLFQWLVFYGYGRALELNTGAKTVTVRTDPVTQLDGTTTPSLTLAFQYGRESWDAGDIVGKRVRVGYDNVRKIRWVDDTIRVG